MYYIEKIIDDVICCKFTGSDDWKPLSIESATKKIIELQERIKELKAQLEMCVQNDN